MQLHLCMLLNHTLPPCTPHFILRVRKCSSACWRDLTTALSDFSGFYYLFHILLVWFWSMSLPPVECYHIYCCHNLISSLGSVKFRPHWFICVAQDVRQQRCYQHPKVEFRTCGLVCVCCPVQKTVSSWPSKILSLAGIMWLQAQFGSESKIKHEDRLIPPG